MDRGHHAAWIDSPIFYFLGAEDVEKKLNWSTNSDTSSLNKEADVEVQKHWPGAVLKMRPKSKSSTQASRLALPEGGRDIRPPVWEPICQTQRGNGFQATVGAEPSDQEAGPERFHFCLPGLPKWSSTDWVA
jgi:hypothetical protein